MDLGRRIVRTMVFGLGWCMAGSVLAAGLLVVLGSTGALGRGVGAVLGFALPLTATAYGLSVGWKGDRGAADTAGRRDGKG